LARDLLTPPQKGKDENEMKDIKNGDFGGESSSDDAAPPQVATSGQL
jgi:hypothetical protein